ncbi:MAG: sugar ABC transporter permease [Spirochaetaceae bacterium]|nr:sugar ABC transporter permease [Spirochaetaceae bacterium]
MKNKFSLQKQHQKEALMGYAFIAPQMLGFLFFIMIPLISIFVYSIHTKNLLFGTNIWCGMDNYKALFYDSVFLKTIKNTIFFSLGVVPINLICSLFLAFYLCNNYKENKYLKTIVFLPVVTSGVAWAIVFKYILQGGTDGPLNYFLSLIGIQGPNWLHDTHTAMISVIITRVIKNLGTNVLIFSGAILNLPNSLIEAATLDGAKGIKLFTKIKLPLLMPSILMVMMVTVIGSMRVFDTIKLMTDGGPEGSTMVIVYYIYHQAFKMFNTGYASSISVILFSSVLVLTIIQWSLRKRLSYYEN